MAGGVLLSVGPGCALRESSEASATNAVPLDETRVYARYRFDPSPDVLNIGIQPLWIPACILWEVMERDPQLRADLQRVHCRLVPYGFYKGQDVNEFMRDGKLQGGMAGDLPAVTAAIERNIRIVSLVQQGPCAVIGRERVPISGLRGRRIGYSPGSNAHFALAALLEENGLTPRDVQLVPMDVSLMARALAEGKIDAFAAWEPTPTLALMENPRFEVLARKDSRGYLYFTRDFAERRPQVVRALVAAEIRALRWLRLNDKNLYNACRWAHGRAAAFSGGEEFPLTVYDFLRLARRDLLRIPSAPQLTPGLLAPGGELDLFFEISRRWSLLPPGADMERVRRSFAPEIVSKILSATPRTPAQAPSPKPGPPPGPQGS